MKRRNRKIQGKGAGPEKARPFWFFWGFRIPLQVIRTYDSRNKAHGDFGVGWTLDIHNIQVEESGVMGDGWDTYIQSGGLLQGNWKRRSRPLHRRSR